jgi:hypothetical protein
MKKSGNNLNRDLTVKNFMHEPNEFLLSIPMGRLATKTNTRGTEELSGRLCRCMLKQFLKGQIVNRSVTYGIGYAQA